MPSRLTELPSGLKERAFDGRVSFSQYAPETELDCASDRSLRPVSDDEGIGEAFWRLAVSRVHCERP